MDFLSQYLKIKPTVAQVLLDKPETRDDDVLLMLTIWEIQAGRIQTYSDFKDSFLRGKLAIPATITRSRRKLQEDNISLRGKLYDKRKAQEIYVSSQIKFDFE